MDPTCTECFNTEGLLRSVRDQMMQFQRSLASGPSYSVARVILAVEEELQRKPLPEWIRLFPLGWVLINNTLIFSDKASLRSLVVDFRTRGVDLVIDYEPQGSGRDCHPAAGWIKELQARDDGLYARVDWTQQAQDYLGKKKYRYFSPIVRFDPETRKPYALMRVDLTEVPDFYHFVVSDGI
jgi:hypothetical protein